MKKIHEMLQSLLIAGVLVVAVLFYNGEIGSDHDLLNENPPPLVTISSLQDDSVTLNQLFDQSPLPAYHELTAQWDFLESDS